MPRLDCVFWPIWAGSGTSCALPSPITGSPLVLDFPNLPNLEEVDKGHTCLLQLGDSSISQPIVTLLPG